MFLETDLPESLKDLWEIFLTNQQAQIFLSAAICCMAVAFAGAIAAFIKNGHGLNETKTFAKYMAIAGGIVIFIVLFIAGILILATKISGSYDIYSVLGN